METSGIDEDLILKINEALVESGERERLKQLVKEKLSQAGWFEKVRAEADREARARNNIEAISPQELVTAIYPRADELIPTELRSELQNEIRKFLEAHIHIA